MNSLKNGDKIYLRAGRLLPDPRHERGSRRQNGWRSGFVHIRDPLDKKLAAAIFLGLGRRHAWIRPRIETRVPGRRFVEDLEKGFGRV